MTDTRHPNSTYYNARTNGDRQVFELVDKGGKQFFRVFAAQYPNGVEIEMTPMDWSALGRLIRIAHATRGD